MKKVIGTVLLAIIASELFSMTSAKNVACINANAEIKRLYCDGVDITNQLPNRQNPNKCDCIELPNVCKIIAIKARGIKDGQQTQSGIQFCQSAPIVPYKDWVCSPATHVYGKSWPTLEFNHGPSHWLSPSRPSGKCTHCHNLKHINCKSTCFWNSGSPPAPALDCVLEQCADACLACKSSRAGNCDLGMCRYGGGSQQINTATNVASCPRQCRVDLSAWSTLTGKGYIKLTDMESKSVDIFEANVAGQYFAIIDMSQCVFSQKNFTTWTWAGYSPLLGPSPSTITFLNGANYAPYVNAIAVAMGVGPPTSMTIGSNVVQAPTPSFQAYVLGTNNYNYIIPVTKNQCTASAVFTGINTGPTIAMSDFTSSNPC